MCRGSSAEGGVCMCVCVCAVECEMWSVEFAVRSVECGR